LRIADLKSDSLRPGTGDTTGDSRVVIKFHLHSSYPEAQDTSDVSRVENQFESDSHFPAVEATRDSSLSIANCELRIADLKSNSLRRGSGDTTGDSRVVIKFHLHSSYAEAQDTTDVSRVENQFE
jgi:hypothetical protein